MPLAFYVDHFSPYIGPHWGKIGIRYYGLAYMLGFLAAAGMFFRYAKAGRSRLPAPLIADFMVWIALGTMIGGRLGYMLLYSPGDLLHDPLTLFTVWDGGMASHGGMIGVTVAIAWFARRHHLPFLHLGDLVVSAAPIGLFFGRIANFINGELWGKPSVVPWAMLFPNAPDGGRLPRHPSQLYEAGLEGLLLFLYLQLRFWKSDVVRRQPGRLAGEFFVVYAIVRIFCERFREPDEGISLILGLSRGTFYSLIVFLVGLFLIAWTGARRRPAA
ncbi:MAG TPA: prolipoprotein diacylglyceryl transferase [Opitutaceae bacterium]|jgi:phosphatidylglycerol:prolipoprotein diacylglycerol transferase|nr:prolipoprotein diacylglyceryl transferase [Opitutaceae bacterium]